MAQTNMLLLSQIAGYVMGLILSYCIVVPMSMHLHEFRGHCLLFSRGYWGGDGQLDVEWASRAYCDYVMAVGVLMNIVCCVQIYRLSVLMYRGRDSSFLSAFLEAVGCAALCVLAVAAALFVTLGFMTWCELIVQRFPSCDIAAGQVIDKKDNITTNAFYIEMGSVQLGAWGTFATCVGLCVCATLKVSRYHQLENIQVSMFRERQRLLNEGSDPPSAPGRSTPPLAALPY